MASAMVDGGGRGYSHNGRRDCGGRVKDCEVMTVLTVDCKINRVASSTINDVHFRYVDSGSTCVLSGIGCEEGVKGECVGCTNSSR